MKTVLLALIVALAACSDPTSEAIDCHEIGAPCVLGGTCYPEAHQGTMSGMWMAELMCWIPCDEQGTCAHIQQLLWDDRDMKHEIEGTGCYCVPEIYK